MLASVCFSCNFISNWASRCPGRREITDFKGCCGPKSVGGLYIEVHRVCSLASYPHSGGLGFVLLIRYALHRHFFFSDRLSKFHVGVLKFNVNYWKLLQNSICLNLKLLRSHYKKWEEDNITGINLITYIALGSLKVNSLRSRVGSEPSFVKLHEIHICMVSSHLTGWQRKWSIKVISSCMQAVFEDTTFCNPSLSKRAWTFLPWLFHSVGSLNNLTITTSLLYLISKHILERNPVVHITNM